VEHGESVDAARSFDAARADAAFLASISEGDGGKGGGGGRFWRMLLTTF
jgi:hypothetical protein